MLEQFLSGKVGKTHDMYTRVPAIFQDKDAVDLRGVSLHRTLTGSCCRVGRRLGSMRSELRRACPLLCVRWERMSAPGGCRTWGDLNRRRSRL
jgi:hypothetical protein